MGILCLTLFQTIFSSPNPLAVHLNETELCTVTFLSSGCFESLGKDTIVEKMKIVILNYLTVCR